MKRFAGLILILMVGTGSRGSACPFDLPVRESKINGHVLSLEIATSEVERKCGLSGRESLPMDRGMLFVLPRRMPVEFWMNDVKIPLTIVFLNHEKKIVDIQTMDLTRPNKLYFSPGPIDFVIELNRDWVAHHKVKVGDVVDMQ
jgi:uncharacterized protein